MDPSVHSLLPFAATSPWAAHIQVCKSCKCKLRAAGIDSRTAQDPLYESLTRVPCLIAIESLSSSWPSAASSSSDSAAIYKSVCPCDSMIIFADAAPSAAAAAAAHVAGALVDSEGVLPVVVINQKETVHKLLAAGAVMLTPEHVADALRSNSNTARMPPATAAAVLDFLFKNHPLPPPPLDDLPCLPGTKPQIPTKYTSPIPKAPT